MFRGLSTGILLFAVLLSSVSAAKVEVGDVLLKDSFAGETMPKGWSMPNPAFTALAEESLQFDLPVGGKNKNATVRKTLPVERYRGTRLRISARVKAENVAAPPNAWNGIKIMLTLETPEGKRWLQKSQQFGTFDWKTIRFDAVVPNRTTSAVLILGLENTTGRVQFRDVEISVVGKKRTIAAGERPKPDVVYKGHNLPRLRGAMISPERFGPKDIEVLAGRWKANHIRWQLTWDGFPNGPADTATVAQYNAWIEEQCKLLDAMLPECEKYGVRVCLDLHTPPGGRLPKNEGGAMRLFREKRFQDAFVEIWRRLATRYRNAKAIWAYDILNEPVEGVIPDSEGLSDWRELALKTSRAIRRIDPRRAIVVEAAPWGGPEALDWFEPFDPVEVPNVVYSAHMYTPHAFTHQGVNGSPVGLVYPGTVQGKDWNKAELRKALSIPMEYAKDYGVHIYIGEFGAIRWAPDGSAYRYLKDCIEIFEEEGWDWAYHAFREWDGWSVEHGGDKDDHEPAAEPTDRELLLRSWFEKNRR